MVALPDPRRENRLFLAIESPDKTPPADMVTALATFNANCAPYERIDDLYSLAELPRTELGKLARATLTTVISQRTGSVAIS
jgi:acyl-coenzyme A synthetase/AMP-(fatty) acid ligase